MSPSLTAFAYLVAGVLFVLALRGLSSPTTSRQGNLFGMVGMAIAIVATLLHHGMSGSGYMLIILAIVIGGGIGVTVSRRIQMTSLPQLVAAFHSLVGLAAVFVAAAAINAPAAFGIGTPGHIHGQSLVEMSIGLAIGAVTFTGSLIAFAKLQALMKGTPITFKYQHLLNAALGILLVLLVIIFCLTASQPVFWLIALVALALGFLLIIPIGGADMPVVVSMLNSYSGWAACGIGFTIQNLALIITGALVGASGAILSYIMCKGMNRSIFNVLLGGFGTESGGPAAASSGEQRPVKSGNADDAAFIMKNASKVIIVPGYGMAVAQAQHALREMADVLKAEGVVVKYAIHPVAGRMPGHMNVLLAEANVPYEDVFELEEINGEFSTADVVYVIGANDVTNPAAKTDKTSAIYGMPILEVEKAATVLFIKRSMASGYAGVENELFFRPNTMMLFADAKKMTEEIVQALGK
ncbi:NAD(P)(+) transhydrogenase (Re/Si-specific) subunit beta [Acidisphaera sp. L21]|uniref:NAD(P)(+) transhydrogenase (Re/Si-specific) subunit beta n=1 Tax=Acidisphaera sp. L21 TaxID=1641851 RepID=UPI00131D6ECE|nr:NAD(P)(+) transhydrogenase (Re/Si-specific) subunit beta [Acidisphaera sp. L21]